MSSCSSPILSLPFASQPPEQTVDQLEYKECELDRLIQDAVEHSQYFATFEKQELIVQTDSFITDLEGRIQDLDYPDQIPDSLRPTIDKMCVAWAQAYLQCSREVQACNALLWASGQARDTSLVHVMVNLNGRFQNDLNKILCFLASSELLVGREELIWMGIHQLTSKGSLSFQVRFLRLSQDLSKKVSYLDNRYKELIKSHKFSEAETLAEAYLDSRPQEAIEKRIYLARLSLDRADYVAECNFHEETPEKAWQALKEYGIDLPEGLYLYFYRLSQPLAFLQKLSHFKDFPKAEKKLFFPLYEKILMDQNLPALNYIVNSQILFLFSVNSLCDLGYSLAKSARTKAQLSFLEDLILAINRGNQHQRAVEIVKRLRKGMDRDQFIGLVLSHRTNPFELIPLIEDPLTRSAKIEQAYIRFFEAKDLPKMKDCLDLFQGDDMLEDQLRIRQPLDHLYILSLKRELLPQDFEVLYKLWLKDRAEFLDQMYLYYDYHFLDFLKVAEALSKTPLFFSEIMIKFIGLVEAPNTKNKWINASKLMSLKKAVKLCH